MNPDLDIGYAKYQLEKMCTKYVISFQKASI